jgi:ketosteroid isomerase-like protein
VTTARGPDEGAAVRAANDAFYRAFESLDLAEMEQVWSPGDHVACIHPGWSRLHGWPAVRRSWALIFENASEMRFTITDVDVHVRGDVAWVHCTENILAESQGNLSITSVLATNLFERRGSGWAIVHHHASHVLTPGEGPSEGP